MLAYLSKCAFVFAENVKLLSFWGNIKFPSKALLPLRACTMAHNLASDVKQLDHQKGKYVTYDQKNKS